MRRIFSVQEIPPAAWRALGGEWEAETVREAEAAAAEDAMAAEVEGAVLATATRATGVRLQRPTRAG